MHKYLSLKKLSKKEKLTSTIEVLGNKEDQKSQLVLAFFNKDKKVLAKLKSEHIVSDDIWNVMIKSISY